MIDLRKNRDYGGEQPRPLHCLVLGAALACLAACGDTDSLGGHLADVSGSSGAGGSGAGGTSGSAGSGSGAGPGGIPDEVTLEMDPFVVLAGREAFMCQTFANPFGADDVYLREFESHVTPGSHHVILNYVEPAFARDGGLAPCTGPETPAGPFTTQSADDVYTYPDGIAARLPGRAGLRLISHYFNASGSQLTANVRVTLRTARPEAVAKVAFLQAMSNVAIDVPPRETRTFQGGMQVAQGRQWDLLWLLPHMHSHGVAFRVTTGTGAGEMLFETDRWDVPAYEFDPPFRLNAGDSLNYACTFFNDTDVPLTFGESAASNEMCSLIFQYTSSDGAP
jgi:hypothetical protein